MGRSLKNERIVNVFWMKNHLVSNKSTVATARDNEVDSKIWRP
jgi:hypothetical protein